MSGKRNSIDVLFCPAPLDLAAEKAIDASLEHAGCLSCGGSTDLSADDLFDTRFGIDGTFSVRRCLGCGLEQLFPVPTAARLKQLYESYYNFGGEKGTLYTRLRQLFFSSVLYRLWVALDGDISFHARKGRGRLLDIGCNEGRGLAIYRNNGFDVEGMELNGTAAAAARSGGFTVHTVEVNDFCPDRSFDVVVLSNVLEHTRDPKAMLAAARRLLGQHGKLWISCPNSRSWLRTVFGRYWINWHVPFHISHFSAATLNSLLTEAGFTGVEIRQVTPALWVGSSILARIFVRPGRPTRELRNPLLVLGLLVLVRFLCFPWLCLGNWRERGDCLVATAVLDGATHLYSSSGL